MGGVWEVALKKKTIAELKLKFPATNINGTVAFLHFRFTVIVLFVLAGLLSTLQFSGEVIRCTSEGPGELDEMANWYCLVHSTYTVPKSNPAASAHPGVAPVRLPVNGGGQVIRHRYYLWIQPFLFILGMFFYLPRFLWKSLEQGRFQLLTSSLTRGAHIEGLTASDRSKLKRIAKYFVISKGTYYWYFCQYLLCELLYLVNVLVQLVVMDKFFGNEFTKYGLSTLSFAEEEPGTRVDGLEAIFPKVAKCNFDKYGPSGNPVHHDFICLLPHNMLSEKVFIWIWLWFVVLAVITLLSCLSWMVFMCCSYYRLWTLLPPSPGTVTNISHDYIYQNFTISDHFFIYLLQLNFEPPLYDYFLKRICIKLEDQDLDDDDPKLTGISRADGEPTKPTEFTNAKTAPPNLTCMIITEISEKPVKY